MEVVRPDFAAIAKKILSWQVGRGHLPKVALTDADCMQEAILAVMESHESYDYDKYGPLSAESLERYSWHAVRGSVLDYLRDNAHVGICTRQDGVMIESLNTLPCGLAARETADSEEGEESTHRVVDEPAITSSDEALWLAADIQRLDRVAKSVLSDDEYAILCRVYGLGGSGREPVTAAVVAEERGVTERHINRILHTAVECLKIALRDETRVWEQNF